MEHSFIIEGRPVPKGRPRLGRKGRVYTPESTLVYEQHVADSYDGPKFEGPVQVLIDLDPDKARVTVMSANWSSPLRGDADNYLKAILDGLQGKAFDNDRQVVFVQVDKQ